MHYFHYCSKGLLHYVNIGQLKQDISWQSDKPQVLLNQYVLGETLLQNVHRKHNLQATLIKSPCTAGYTYQHTLYCKGKFSQRLYSRVGTLGSKVYWANTLETAALPKRHCTNQCCWGIAALPKRIQCWRISNCIAQRILQIVLHFQLHTARPQMWQKSVSRGMSYLSIFKAPSSWSQHFGFSQINTASL